MGWNDNLSDYNRNTYLRACPECKKIFKVEEVDQTPGFRWSEDMVCPYCGHIVRTSLEYEFHTYKLEEN